jgi:hypothetical protein
MNFANEGNPRPCVMPAQSGGLSLGGAGIVGLTKVANGEPVVEISHLFIPEGIDLGEILPPHLTKYHDAAAFFLHRVTCASIFSCNVSSANKTGTPIRHVDMAPFFRRA